MSQFQGAWPALLTPFTADNQVNVPVLRRLVDYLIGKGSGGLYVCGSTGEGVYMTVAERQQTLEAVIEQVNGRVPVIAHVGAVALPDATALASHAQVAGADAIASIIPPLYTNVPSTVGYFTALGAAAPETPLLTYIFGGPTDAVALMRALMGIPTLAGSKYTGPNMFEFRRIVELGNREWTVFSGMDEQCAFAAMVGASGNIGSTLNFMQGLYSQMQAAIQQGDLTRGVELQLAANKLTGAMIDVGFMSALKAVMTRLDFDCGAPRLPNRSLPADQQAALFAKLDELQFDEIVAM
ncbi:MAG: dihydrodipicolinate synthase family protein [Caldilineaceae bacterium]|nr:dihydrodipicolinate synthase family protein [Caldilineaceae bacterium]